MKANEATTLTHPLITAERLRRKAIIYLRQSSPEQVEKNTGSQAFQRSQVEMARAYGWSPDNIEIVEEDLGKSGSTVGRRSGWKKMLEEIAANTVGAVFAVNISRLGRQMLPVEELRLLAQYHGTLLCLDNRFFDPTNPDDTFMTQIGASIAQLENKKRAEHMSKARMAKARQGAVVSSLPVGWIKTTDGKNDQDPAVKDAIYTIIDTFMQVRSIRQTIKALAKAALKVPTRHGPSVNWKKPTLDNVRKLLINPAYAGTYVFGKNTITARRAPVGERPVKAGQSPGASMGETTQ